MRAMIHLAAISGALVSSVSAVLVAYYPMDDMDGSGAQSRGPVLTPVNLMPEDVVSGKFGSAVQFTAARQTLLENVGETPVAADHSFAASLWVNASGSQSNLRVLAFGSTENNSPLFAMGTSPLGGELRYLVRSGWPTDVGFASGVSTAEPFDESWHHVLWNNVGSEARVYIDGVLDSVFEFTAGPTDLNTMSIGGIRRVFHTHQITAKIDDVSLWDEPLSEGQISALARGASPLSVPEPSALVFISLAMATFFTGRSRSRLF